MVPHHEICTIVGVALAGKFSSSPIQQSSQHTYCIYSIKRCNVVVFSSQLEGRCLFEGSIYYYGAEGSELCLIRCIHFN